MCVPVAVGPGLSSNICCVQFSDGGSQQSVG